MSKEEKDLYRREEYDTGEEEPGEIEDDEYEDYMFYHDFYGF